jgi:hypothetical protein
MLAEAVALLDSIVDIAGPDIGEDRRRYNEFKTTRLAVPLDGVKAWVASWGSANELPARNRAKLDDFSFARRRRGCRAAANLSPSQQYTHNCHHPPPGRRRALPDDRLQRMIK